MQTPGETPMPDLDLRARRSITEPTEMTAYIVYAPATTVLAEMVHVAGRRWTVEERLHRLSLGLLGRQDSPVRRRAPQRFP
jgi:hypothetical protein